MRGATGCVAFCGNAVNGFGINDAGLQLVADAMLDDSSRVMCVDRDQTVVTYPPSMR